MIHYLKKQWRLSTLTCLFAITAYGAQALIQLALMKVFDAVVLLDLRSTIFWTAVDLTCWGGYFLFTALQEHCQAKTIRCEMGCITPSCARAIPIFISPTPENISPG